MTPATADVLLAGGTVVTMDDARRVFADGAVAVRDGVVAAVGPAAEVRAAWTAPATLDVAGRVALPGLVNAHVHLTGPALFPGLEPAGTPVEQHMARYVLPAHAAATADDERAAAALSALRMAQAGCSGFVEAGVVRFPEAVADGLAAVGLRGAIGGWASDRMPLPFAPGDAGAARAAIDAALATAGTVAARTGGLVAVWPDLIGHGGCSDALYVHAAARAAEHGLGWTFHMSAFDDDRAAFRAEHGADPLVHLDRLGVLDERVVVAHGIHLTDDEVAVLARTGTTVAFCPGAALRLATGVTRVGRHPDLPHVALGTDTVNASNHVDVLRAAATACDTYVEARGDRGALPAEAALGWATRGGGRALGAGTGPLGTLVVGAPADIAVFDAGLPAPNPANALVHGAPRATDLVVAGRVVMADGRIDAAAAIVRDATAAAVRLADRAGLPSRTGWIPLDL